MRAATWSFAVCLAFAPVSFAQSRPQPVPLQTTSGTGFSGAPYSGKETTVKVQTLSDGTTTNETFVELVWRDALGRTRREMIRHADSGAEYRSIIITNPVGGIYLKWEEGNPSTRRVVSIWPVTPAQRVTAPPASVAPSPTNPAATASTPDFQREVLPPQEINGVYAEGTRTTRTIRLEGESSGRVIQVTNELWLSPDLKIIVRHIHDDPRSGTETTNVTGVVRGDPDPSLFLAPQGYETADHRVQNRE
jgi:hypothetical protein